MPATNKTKKIITIIPAYNEALSIEETIKNLQKLKPACRKLGYDFKVYVINDGSKDDTGILAEKAGADKVIRHKINYGLGAAVRTGLVNARKDGAEIAIKFDADLQHKPEDILELIMPIINDSADVVYGKRFEKIEYKMPFIRRIGNRVFTRILRMLTHWPLEDSQPGILAVNKDYLEVFNIPGNYNYTQQILLDSYHKGMRFAHVAVHFRKRETGKSFVSLKYPFIVLYQIILVIIGVKPLLIFASIGFIFIFIASMIIGIEMFHWIIGAAPKPVVHVNAVLGLLQFGLQSLFFGFLAELIVRNKRT